MIQIAIDTNVLVALIDESDTWRKKALGLYNGLQRAKAEYLFFDCVINETVSIIIRRLEEKRKTEKLNDILSRLSTLVPEDKVTWISHEIRGLYKDIISLVSSTQGHLNFHDALIALILRKRKIKYLASFDPDFDQIEWVQRIFSEQFPQ